MKSINVGEEFINQNGDDPMQVLGYRLNRIKFALTWLAILATAGLLRLIFFWKPSWMLYCTHDCCQTEFATKLLLKNKYDQEFIEDVVEQAEYEHLWPLANGEFKKVGHLRTMKNKKCRYLWNEQEEKFIKVTGLDFGKIQCQTLHQHQGLSSEESKLRNELFGPNLIDIDVEPLLKILLTEALDPFYIYQFFAITFWALDGYIYYPIYIIIMSIVSLTITTYQTKKNQMKLREKVSGANSVLVCRPNGQTESVSSTELVPGDVIVIENRKYEKSDEQSKLYFDAILLSGEVIVDESMLTGESNPVTKTSLRKSQDLYDHKKDAKHVLYCGTRVIQARQYGNEPLKAVVVRTNFQTTKGELVKSILFPKPIDFRFSRHINHFLIAMSGLALIGFIYTVVLKVSAHEPIEEFIFEALDLITIVVPPELPAALTIANIFAERRLRNNKIFCMSPSSINISGCIDCVVFDKTGTLTEDDVTLEELVEIDYESEAFFRKPVKQATDLEPTARIIQCLATCHSLKLLDGEMIGESLELHLFDKTKWALYEPTDSIEQYGFNVPTVVKTPNLKTALGIVKQFPFSSKMARMSVVVKNLNESGPGVEFYIKGAPERVVERCKPESVPGEFSYLLKEYTQKSYRVLAVAYKPLPEMSVEEAIVPEMEFFENDLILLGLVVMRNKLKSSTLETIQTLNEANTRIIMATGDNLMTALSVAKECSILIQGDEVAIIEAEEPNNLQTSGIPKLQLHFQEKVRTSKDYMIPFGEQNYRLAMTGRTLQLITQYYPELLPKIAVRCAVYARVMPEQKQQLVEMLQGVDYHVSMVGDGANDCGALKVAHAGISLADTEASVASAFTCLTGQISCVVDLLKDGRAAMVSAFGVVRYMACYNITTFLAICILYYFDSSLTDIQNLYQDVGLISLYVLLFGKTYPYQKLAPTRPPISLIGLSQFSSIVIQLSLVAIVQFASVVYLHMQPWYIPNDTSDGEHFICHDNYALYIIQVFQYIILLIVFSKSTPYRKKIYTNYLLTLSIIVTGLITFGIVMFPEWPFPNIATVFGLYYQNFPMGFRFQLFGFSVIHFVVAFCAEKFIVENYIVRVEREYNRLEYERVFKETAAAADWIPT